MSEPMLIEENKMGAMPIPKLIITTSIPRCYLHDLFTGTDDTMGI